MMTPNMQFEMTHQFFDCEIEKFSEIDAPSWLTSAKTRPGSTMDYRWFWERVLALPIGESISTDFHNIVRVQ